MKTFLLLFGALAIAAGQTPPAGTVTKLSNIQITATAGGINCTFSNQTPSLPTGVNFSCTDGTAKLQGTAVIPVGSTNGVVQSFNSGGNAVTWIFTQATATSGVSYQIAANGTQSTGSF